MEQIEPTLLFLHIDNKLASPLQVTIEGKNFSLKEVAENPHKALEDISRKYVIAPRVLVLDRPLQAREKSSTLFQTFEEAKDFFACIFAIRASRIPWIFASDAPIFDWGVLLASACHCRLALATEVKLGFSQSFTYFDKDLFAALDLKSLFLLFEHDLILTSQEASKAGFWHALLFGKNAVPEKISKYLAENVEKDFLENRDNSFTLSFLNAEDFWEDFRSRSNWSYEKVLKEKRGGMENRNFALQFLLARCSMLFLQQEQIPPKFNQHPEKKAIAFNLAFKQPATYLLQRLLEQGFFLIFHCQDPKSLYDAFEKILEELKKKIPPEKLQHYLREQIAWFRGAPVRDKLLKCHFYEKDLWVLEFNSAKTMVLILQKLSKDGSGCCEIFSQHGEEADIATIKWYLHELVGEILVSAERITYAPMSIWIKSHFLEELLRVSIQSGRLLAELLNILHRFGWGFVAAVKNWDHFLILLNQYHDIFPHVYQLDTLENESVHSLSDLSNVSSVAREKDHPKFPLQNEVQFSHHFGFFVSQLAASFRQEFSELDSKEINAWFIYSLGYPTAYISPSVFLQEFGVRRAQSYRC